MYSKDFLNLKNKKLNFNNKFIKIKYLLIQHPEKFSASFSSLISKSSIVFNLKIK